MIDSIRLCIRGKHLGLLQVDANGDIFKDGTHWNQLPFQNLAASVLFFDPEPFPLIIIHSVPSSKCPTLLDSPRRKNRLRDDSILFQWFRSPWPHPVHPFVHLISSQKTAEQRSLLMGLNLRVIQVAVLMMFRDEAMQGRLFPRPHLRTGFSTLQTKKYLSVIKHGNGKWTIKIGDVPIKTSIYPGFSVAVFDYQMVKQNRAKSTLKIWCQNHGVHFLYLFWRVAVAGT